MNVTGNVRISSILADLEIEALPEGSHWKESDSIDLIVAVDDDEAYSALPSSYTEIDPIELNDELDQTDVQNLAAAIRRGDKAEAEQLLDRVFVTDGTVTEWIQRGRYGSSARSPDCHVASVPKAKAA